MFFKKQDLINEVRDKLNANEITIKIGLPPLGR